MGEIAQKQAKMDRKGRSMGRKDRYVSKEDEDGRNRNNSLGDQQEKGG